MIEDGITTAELNEAAAGDAIMELVRECGSGTSICPTEAARRLADHDGNTGDIDAWRRHMPDIRRTVLRLAQSGAIDILRKGKVVSPDAARGVIRLRLRKTMEEH